MAVTPTDTNKAFLREVDEELRREQVATVWSRYGGWIVLGLLAALIALGAGLWWRHHRENARGVEGEQLQAAYDNLAANNRTAADKALVPLTTSASPAYRALAQMSRADILLDKKDLKGAARLFAGVAADAGTAQPLRDLALVRQTAAEFDTLAPQAVVSRLRPLAIKGSPWFGSAGEMVGVAYLRMNRRDLAGPLFSQIAAAEGIPDSLRQRAVQMASSISADAPTDKGIPAK